MFINDQTMHTFKVSLRTKLKPWMLPLAMIGGVLFHESLDKIQWLVPYLIFTMLLITFCRVKPSSFRLGAMIWKLLAVQLVGAVVVFLALRVVSVPLAQSVMLCVLCPTATAAPVVTGMLGGDIGRVASYSIVSNMAAALLAPVLFVWAGASAEMSVTTEFVLIASRVAPLICLPLGAALLMYFIAPRAHAAVAGVQGISFYLWAVSLFLVVGRAVSFVLDEPVSAIPLMIAMAVCAGLVCIAQFYIGRRIGWSYGDAVSAAQGLGQKNTVLAVWMALNYLSPIASIGPAAYIAWQNTINSYQLYKRMRRDSRVSSDTGCGEQSGKRTC